MTTLIVLFNLKPGVDAAKYEQWARTADLPTVNGMRSVERFDVLRSRGLLSGEATAPYQYVEVLQVDSVEALRADIGATPAMADVARQFREFADDPIFIVTESI